MIYLDHGFRGKFLISNQKTIDISSDDFPLGFKVKKKHETKSSEEVRQDPKTEKGYISLGIYVYKDVLSHIF